MYMVVPASDDPEPTPILLGRRNTTKKHCALDYGQHA